MVAVRANRFLFLVHVGHPAGWSRDFGFVVRRVVNPDAGRHYIVTAPQIRGTTVAEHRARAGDSWKQDSRPETEINVELKILKSNERLRESLANVVGTPNPNQRRPCSY